MAWWVLTTMALAPAAAVAPARSGTGKLPATLRVGTEGVYTPFSYHDASGGLTGYDVDVMNAVAQKAGVKVQYVETPWDSMFAALKANRFDVVANEVSPSPERKALYDLSDPYVSSTGVVVVAKNNTTIKGLGDLKGKRAAENLTSNWQDVAKKAGAQIVGVDGLTQSIEALEQGRVDALVNDKLAISNYLATNPNAGVKVVAQTDDTSNSVFAARKGSGYMPQINQAIKDLRADGTLQSIYDKYFTAKAKPPSTWQLIKDNAGSMLRATLTATIPLTIISFGLGMIIALVVALGRMSTNPLFSAPARLFVSIIRGTPLLVQLFLIFYGLPQLGIRVNPFPASVVAFSLNVGGYAAEIIRSAVLAVPRGQWEAASTIGMGHATTLRRIIVPQAARIAVPPLSNTLISLVKDTSLAASILVVELFRQAQIAAAPTYEFLGMYGVAAAYYWVICLALSFVQTRLETRLSRFVAA